MAIRDIVNASCIGCKKCIDACPMDVIRWNNETKKPVITYWIDCITCFNCELNCPKEAIFVEPKRAKPVVFPWRQSGQE